jgi:DNA replication protein DnaC
MESLGKAIFDSLAAQSLNNYEEGDYTDSEGFLCCGKCHTRKQHDITLPAFGDQPERIIRVGIVCECRKKEIEAERAAEERRQFLQRMEVLRRDGITDPAYLQYTFDQDDNRNPEVSEVCLSYVENWDEMFKDNIGILFYGGVGTGKSFLACCIANALIEKLVPVSVTNFPRILNKLQGFGFGEERQEFIDKLQRYKLMVIDDLGVERDTSYSVEQVFNVVDTRSRSGMPLIVTTNLSMEDLKNPPSLAHARIYDRVLEMCPIRLKLVGESRRKTIANERRDKAKKLLGLK